MLHRKKKPDNAWGILARRNNKEQPGREAGKRYILTDAPSHSSPSSRPGWTQRPNCSPH